MEKYLTFDC